MRGPNDRSGHRAANEDARRRGIADLAERLRRRYEAEASDAADAFGSATRVDADAIASALRAATPGEVSDVLSEPVSDDGDRDA